MLGLNSARQRLIGALVATVCVRCGPGSSENIPPECTPYTGPEWVEVPPGEYVLGNSEFFIEERGRSILTDSLRPPLRRVVLDYTYRVQNTEVTSESFLAVMGYDPSPELSFLELTPVEQDFLIEARTPQCPVERVSWFEALFYANALSTRDGLEPCYDLRACSGIPADGDYWCEGIPPWSVDCPGYRLPTSAEWEIAARAGTEWDFVWSPADEFYGSQSYALLGPNLVRLEGLSGVRPYPVGSLCPNAWGLYDVQGNVEEWVMDGPYGVDPFDFSTLTFLTPEEGEVIRWSPGDSEFRESRGGHVGRPVPVGGLGVRMPSWPVSSSDTSPSHYWQGFRLVQFVEWQPDAVKP